MKSRLDFVLVALVLLAARPSLLLAEVDRSGSTNHTTNTQWLSEIQREIRNVDTQIDEARGFLRASDQRLAEMSNTLRPYVKRIAEHEAEQKALIAQGRLREANSVADKWKTIRQQQQPLFQATRTQAQHHQTIEARLKRLQELRTRLLEQFARRGGRQRDFVQFAAAWDKYQQQRKVAKTLAPNANRCALVLSMALGIERETDIEASLLDIGGVSKEPQHTNQLKRYAGYYVQAQQLADRLARDRADWGPPRLMEPDAARAFVGDKRGIIFFEDAWYGSNLQRGKYIDHIDLWDGAKTGSDTAPFSDAKRVWFWELPREEP